MAPAAFGIGFRSLHRVAEAVQQQPLLDREVIADTLPMSAAGRRRAMSSFHDSQNVLRRLAADTLVLSV